MHESGSAMGASFTKPPIALQEAIINEAHAYNKVAIAHSTAMADHIEILNAGVDGMAHTFYDQAPTQELVKAYKRRNAWLNPTLAAMGSLTTEGQAIAEKFARDPRVVGKVPQDRLEHLCRCMNFKAEGSSVEYAYESVRQLKAAGIDIVWFVFVLNLVRFTESCN